MSSYKKVEFMLKCLVFTSLIFSSLTLGYQLNGWWKFSPSTFLICILTASFYPKNWRTKLGMAGPIYWIPISLASCFVFFFISKWLITISLNNHAYNLVNGNYLDYLVAPLQTLNEEFVFRALALTALTKFGLSRMNTIIVPALIFTVLHWLFYAYNMTPENRGLVELPALLTLFLFGIAANSFFLATGNIGTSWALHCGWNLNRFGSKIELIESSSLNRLPEYMTFNLLEGSFSIVVLSFFLAVFSLIFCSSYVNNSD